MAPSAMSSEERDRDNEEILPSGDETFGAGARHEHTRIDPVVHLRTGRILGEQNERSHELLQIDTFEGE
jgi:hypothetical protein